MSEYLICAILASIVSFIGGILWERAYTREVEIKLRKTKLALWIARADKAKAMMMREEALFRTGLIDFYEKYEVRMKKWHWVERKCRKKADEYKR